MAAIEAPNDSAVLAQIAKGAEALATVAALAECVAEYDAAKSIADDAYARTLNNATTQLAGRVSGIIMQATHRMDMLEAAMEAERNEDL